jgi:hypothetical protein
MMNQVPFEQDGRSEVRIFTYLSKCDAPANLRVEQKGKDAVYTWDADSKHTSYTVEAENVTTGFNNIYTLYDNKKTLKGLEYGHEYRLRVRAVCNNNDMYPSDFSDWKTFRLVPPPQRENNFECGEIDKSAIPPITNQELRRDLKEGDIIFDPLTQTNFRIKTAEETSSGVYKGLFYFMLETAGIEFLAQYEKLRVNTDNIYLYGEWETVRTLGFVADVDAITDALTTGDNNESNSGTQDTVQVSFNLPDDPQITYNDSTGTITLTDDKGNEQTIELPKDENGNTEFPVTIVDGSGDTYVVTKDKNGEVKIEKRENKPNEENTSQRITNKSYYSIEGHKFYNGETIYLPLSNKSHKIEAYRDSVTKFSDGSVWSNIVEIVDSATANYIPDIVSENISGSVLSTINNGDTLQCRVVVVKIEFEKDPNQKWGFDENNPETENDYPSFQTTPIQGLKWKSLQVGSGQDNIIINVQPQGAESVITFTSSNPTLQVLNFAPISDTKYKLSVMATTIEESDIVFYVGHFEDDIMRIKCYGMSKQIRPREARVIIVHESNDDVQVVPYGSETPSETTIVISSGNNRFLDSKWGYIGGDDAVIYDAVTGDSVVVAGANKICESYAYNTDVRTTLISRESVQDTLDKYYSQSGFEWIVTSIEEVTINFDLNKDGKIDVTRWETAEMEAISNNINIDATTFSIIVVDNSHDGSLGFSAFFERNPKQIAFVHPINAPNIYMTICHELGHGAFGLQHPFHEFANFPQGGKDVSNIMNYGTRRNKFRKYQWDIIETLKRNR